MTLTSWIALSATSFIFFAILLFGGIIRKKVWMVILSVACVGLGMVTGIIAFIRLSSATIDTVKDVVADRTAEEVYASEFGRGDACAQVIDFYDPSVTLINDKRYICFTSCRAETRRILTQRRYDVVERPTENVIDQLGDKCCHNFFTEERFGPTVMECLSSEGQDAFTLYVSTDSTRVYYIRSIK